MTLRSPSLLVTQDRPEVLNFMWNSLTKILATSSTFKNHYVILKKPSKTYCTAQGTLFSALWWPKCEGNPKNGGYIYMAIRMAQQQRICLPYRRSGFDPWIGKIPWKRKQQPTPVSFTDKSYGQRSLAGYSPWGRKELNMTKRLKQEYYSWFTLC